MYDFFFSLNFQISVGLLSAIIDNKYKMSVIVVLNLYHNYRYIYFSENLCTFIIDSKYEMPVIVVYLYHNYRHMYLFHRFESKG